MLQRLHRISQFLLSFLDCLELPLQGVEFLVHEPGWLKLLLHCLLFDWDGLDLLSLGNHLFARLIKVDKVVFSREANFSIIEEQAVRRFSLPALVEGFLRVRVGSINHRLIYSLCDAGPLYIGRIEMQCFFTLLESILLAIVVKLTNYPTLRLFLFILF